MQFAVFLHIYPESAEPAGGRYCVRVARSDGYTCETRYFTVAGMITEYRKALNRPYEVFSLPAYHAVRCPQCARPSPTGKCGQCSRKTSAAVSQFYYQTFRSPRQRVRFIEAI